MTTPVCSLTAAEVRRWPPWVTAGKLVSSLFRKRKEGTEREGDDGVRRRRGSAALTTVVRGELRATTQWCFGRIGEGGGTTTTVGGGRSPPLTAAQHYSSVLLLSIAFAAAVMARPPRSPRPPPHPPSPQPQPQSTAANIDVGEDCEILENADLQACVKEEDEPPKKKGRGHTSDCWNHFDRLPIPKGGRAKCKCKGYGQEYGCATKGGEFDSIDVAIDGANERTSQIDEDKNHPNIIILDEQE